MSWLKPSHFLCHADLSQSQLKNRQFFFSPLIEVRHGPLCISVSFILRKSLCQTLLFSFHLPLVSSSYISACAEPRLSAFWRSCLLPKYHSTMHNKKVFFAAGKQTVFDVVRVLRPGSDQTMISPPNVGLLNHSTSVCSVLSPPGWDWPCLRLFHW